MAKVLIIDDDTTALRMLGQMLKQAKFDVTVADSGSAGIEAVHQSTPDIVLLDLMMPETNGWDVCQTVRGFSDVPILVLTAVTDTQQVARCLEAGANDYLVKPVPKGVLVSHIQNLISH